MAMPRVNRYAELRVANLKIRHYRGVDAREKTALKIWRLAESTKNNSPDANDTEEPASISLRNNSSCVASFAVWPRVSTVVYVSSRTNSRAGETSLPHSR